MQHWCPGVPWALGLPTEQAALSLGQTQATGHGDCTQLKAPHVVSGSTQAEMPGECKENCKGYSKSRKASQPPGWVTSDESLSLSVPHLVICKSNLYPRADGEQRANPKRGDRPRAEAKAHSRE